MNIDYTNDDTSLAIDPFLELVDRVWPGEYDRQKTTEAIDRTLNVTAWDDERLVGCVRVLTDGYFFGCITEILVEPDYQGRGIGRELMERAWEASPTGIFLGAQPGKEEFFEKMLAAATQSDNDVLTHACPPMSPVFADARPWHDASVVTPRRAGPPG